MPRSDDDLTNRMADTLVSAPIHLGDLDAVVRTLIEARFMAREINPRLDRAVVLALIARHEAEEKAA